MNIFKNWSVFTSSVMGGSVTADLVARKAASVDAFKSTLQGVRNIVVLCVGTNEINNTAGTGTTAYSALKSYYNSLVADGWTVIVITMTEKYAGVGQQEAERLIFNNLIRTDLSATYMVDTDLLPELTDSTNETYFNADQLHLVEAGYNVLAIATASMLASIYR